METECKGLSTGGQIHLLSPYLQGEEGGENKVYNKSRWRLIENLDSWKRLTGLTQSACDSAVNSQEVVVKLKQDGCPDNLYIHILILGETETPKLSIHRTSEC